VSQRSLEGSTSARFEWYSNRLTFFTAVSYLNTRQRPNYEIDERVRRNEESALTGVQVKVWQKLYLEPSASWSRTRFDSDAAFEGAQLQQTLDRDGMGASLAARWKATPLTQVSVQAQASTDRFRFSPERDSDGRHVLAGVLFRPRALITGEANVGWQTFHSRTGRLPDHQQLETSANLSYTLLGDTAFRFLAKRAIDYSFEVAQPYFVEHGYGLDVQRRLGGRFYAQGGVLRTSYSYQDRISDGQAAAGAGRVDVSHIYTASIGYAASRHSRFGVAGTYSDRRSNEKLSRNFIGSRIGLFVSQGL